MKARIIFIVVITLTLSAFAINMPNNKNKSENNDTTTTKNVETTNTTTTTTTTTTKAKKTTKKKTTQKVVFNANASQKEMMDYALEQVIAKGWLKSEFEAVVSIVVKESSWNANSVNKSSGACGLFQAYPCNNREGRQGLRIFANILSRRRSCCNR